MKRWRECGQCQARFETVEMRVTGLDTDKDAEIARAHLAERERINQALPEWARR